MITGRPLSLRVRVDLANRFSDPSPMTFFDSTPDPSAGQTPHDIEVYLRSCPEGGEVAIRDSQHGFLTFKLAIVVEILSRGRLRTDKPGALGGDIWFMRSGKSFKFPTGQSHLRIPTAEVRNFIVGCHEPPLG